MRLVFELDSTYGRSWSMNDRYRGYNDQSAEYMVQEIRHDGRRSCEPDFCLQVKIIKN
jgi:hypothetical protein